MTDRATLAGVATTGRRASRTQDAVALARTVAGWTEGTGPLHRRLARALRSAAERGDVSPGTRLPSERTLADLLEVSRGTVVAAYEALVEQGLAVRRHGSGTYVSGNPLGSVWEPTAGREILGRFNAAAEGVLDLSLSTPVDTSHLPELDLPAAALVEPFPGHGFVLDGLPALRRQLAQRMTGWGLPVTADDVVVTSGAQQAITLVAQTLVRPGDAVVIETPTFPGAIAAYQRAGARIETVPVDAAGVRTERFAAVARRVRPVLVHVTPTVHNPTGSVLPRHRRVELLGVAAQHGIVVVEDHTLADLVYDDAIDVPAPIAAFASGDVPVVTIGSLSKLLWGGLRIGWLTATNGLLARLGRAKGITDFVTSPVTQLLAVKYLEVLDDAAIARWREQLRVRRDALVDALEATLPQWHFESPVGGLSLWVRLPHADGDRLTAVARRHGVAVGPGSSTSADGAYASHVRLSFTHPPEVLRLGVERLEVAWREIERAV